MAEANGEQHEYNIDWLAGHASNSGVFAFGAEKGVQFQVDSSIEEIAEPNK